MGATLSSSLVLGLAIEPAALPPVAVAPTDWNTPMSSLACQSRLAEEQAFMRATGRPTGMYCKSRPVLYSPAQRVAYVKTPKGASLAIQELFQRQFPDYRWAEPHEQLPNGTFTFTFVREPLKRALSAFAEIDVTYATRASQEARDRMQTAFQHVNRQAGPNGTARILAYFDDLLGHRFGGDDREHWMPTHAYSQLNFQCAHRIDFIGRLENQEADWDAIQAAAGLPAPRRTPFPHAHDSSVLKKNISNASMAVCNRACQLKSADERVALTRAVLQRVCDIYASDFLCLGYRMPPECASMTGEEEDESETPSVIPAVLAKARPLTAFHERRPEPFPPPAPVYVLHHVDAAAAWQLARTADFPNTLFVTPCCAEDRSSQFRFMRGENSFFAPSSTVGAGLLREFDRFGWYQGAGGGTRVAAYAPRAIGIPVCAPTGLFFDSLTTPVRTAIDRALAEAQQLLLVHRYDQVVVVGKGLLAGEGIHAVVGRYIETEVTRQLINPAIAAMSAPLRASPVAGGAGGLRTGSGGGGRGGVGGGANSSSTPHKHFLPGRRRVLRRH